MGLVLKHAMLIAVSHMKGTSKYQTSKKVESLDLSSNFGLVNLVPGTLPDCAVVSG